MCINNVKEVLFRHVSLEGTPYEIGRKEAEIIKNYCPEEINFIFNGNKMIKPASLERVKEAIKIFDKFCPNINEEIKGFADYFGRSPEEIIYYSFTYIGKGNCGHFAVLPQKTADKNTYVGRSYEWNDEDGQKRNLGKLIVSYIKKLGDISPNFFQFSIPGNKKMICFLYKHSAILLIIFMFIAPSTYKI